MAESKFVKIWDLLSKNNFEINEDVCADVLCTICGKIMILPYTATCGCHYCCKCITEFIGQECKKCPGNKDDCSEDFLVMENNVSKNLGTSSKIAKTKVTCPNQSCSFKSKLTDMEDHIRVCPLRTVECPYSNIGCINDGLKGDTVHDHFYAQELFHSQLLIQALNNMQNDFNIIIEDLKAKQTEINELKEEREIHKNLYENIKEDNRQKEAVLEEMKVQITAMKEKEERRECENIVERKEKELQIKGELDELRTEILMIREAERATKADLDDMKTDVMVVKDHYRDNTNDIITIAGNEDFQNMLKKYDDDISTLKSDTLKLKEQLYNVQHDFVWTITEFTKKNGQYSSDTFYKDNYRLCLRAYIDNNIKYGGFTLYSVIMKGDKDDQVIWPMRHTIVVSILNRDSQKVDKSWRINAENYDKSKPVFNRPQADMNDNILCGRCTINDIRPLLTNDSITICCSLSL